MMNRIDAIDMAVKEVYETLGFIRNKSRKKHQAQARAAVGVALSPYCTTYEIGDALDRSRCTCSHYTNNHTNNIKYWVGYSEIYNLVQETIEGTLKDFLMRSKIDLIDSRINTLKLTKKRLLGELHRS